MDIDSKTKIELMSILMAIPTVVGMLWWANTTYSKAENAERVNDKQTEVIEATKGLLIDIRERVIRIEERQKQEGN
jgi:hypothetical protein